MATLEIKLTKSAIGKTKRQKATLEALGLKKINQIVTHQDSPAITGMVKKVNHLVEVLEK